VLQSREQARGRCDLEDHIAMIDDNKAGVRQRAHLLLFRTNTGLHTSGLSTVRIFIKIAKICCKSPAAVQKRREAPRDNWLCSILVRPWREQLESNSSSGKNLRRDFDQRGREDPQPIAQGANEGTNWKTNAFVLSGRQGRETADPDYLKRFSTRAPEWDHER
jgi:hypothetical protein